MIAPTLAIYWDFENIHATLVDERDGDGGYLQTRFRPQPPLVEIEPILELAAQVGRVAIHRAYANWQWLSRYRHELQANAVDLVQLFPLGPNGKNGADIRLAIDVVDDLHRYPHITHVIVIGGDSDYISLAQRCRMLGRVVIGVGVESSTHRHWIAACDDFKLYRVGQGELESDGSVSTDLGDGHMPSDPSPTGPTGSVELLVSAVARLTIETGSPWVVKAGVKPMMMCLEPSFNETTLGFRSFGAFLDAAEPYIRQRVGVFDHEVALAEPVLIDLTDAFDLAADTDSVDVQVRVVERALKRIGIRLPERLGFWAVAREIGAMFAARETAESFAQIDHGVIERLEHLAVLPPVQEIRWTRQVMFKLHLFELFADGAGILLRPVGPEATTAAVLNGLVTTLRDLDALPDELDVLTLALLGSRPDPELAAALTEIANSTPRSGAEPFVR